MEKISIESVIDKSKNGNGRFNLDTNLKDFMEAIKYEVDLPTRLRTMLSNNGYLSRINTIKDLILSYRNSTINWNEKTRRVINLLLEKYGFQELAQKRYARKKNTYF